MKTLVPKTPSETVLLLANLLPLAGIVFLGWRVFDVIMLFWLENVMIGIMNIMKILLVSVREKKPGGLFTAIFFTVHYGMFAFAHGVFVFSLFGGLPEKEGGASPEALLEKTFSIEGIAWIALGLFASHFYSFLSNFVRGGEMDRATTKSLMAAPYGRVVILHITILLGGLAAQATGNSQWAVILLAAGKTMLDMAAHRIAHAKAAESGPLKD